jgi:protease-4
LNHAQLSEVERCLAHVRSKGKKVFAYLESADTTRYQVAALCDQVLLADMGLIDFHAPALSTMMMRDALDLLGVKFDIVRCGDFKGAVEPYMLPEMSPHLRAHYVAMLERMNADVVRRVGTARRLTASQVRELQAERVFPAERALAAGLVDRLVPWVGPEAAVAAALNEKPEFQAIEFGKEKKRSANFMAVFGELFKPKREREIEAESVAVLHLSGQIMDGFKAAPGSMVSGPTVKTIKRLAEDENVKGVVARINSPGGSATASEAIRLALEDLAKAKPLVISMGRLAASGGYWITCLGRPILAEPSTITGSIGVFGMKPNLGPLMRRLGLREELVALDESAGMDALQRGWSDAEQTRMQGLVDAVYERFISGVARSRRMNPGDVLPIAGGRVWSGDQAVQLKLVDRIGGLDDALAMVRQEAKVDDSIEVVHVPEPRNMFDLLLDDFMSVRSLLPQGIAGELLRRSADLDQAITLVLDAIRGDGAMRVWAMGPASLRLR